MPFVATVFALAAVTWGAIYARRGSLLVACGLILVAGYALGHEFWRVQIGPLPVTLDRVLLIGLVAAFAIQWRFGQLAFRPWTLSDWMLAAMLAIFIASAVFSGEPDNHRWRDFEMGPPANEFPLASRDVRHHSTT